MLRNAFICLVSLLAATVLCGTVLAQSHTSNLYYFNPDSSQSNLSLLKREMDAFFSKTGFQIKFQPFTHLVDLEKQFKKAPPEFLFAPRWYIRKHGTELNLRPMLIASHNGKTSYQKVLLVTKHKELRFEGARYLTVAMTSMGPYGETILQKTLFASSKDVVDKINPIIVSKDSDALFALALGQVDMAFVVKENLNLLAQINPNIMQTVHPLLESEPIPMPVLCFTEGVASAADVVKLKRLFLQDKKHRKYFNNMEMLQINDLQAAK